MARIRTIKPDFWTDEEVVELDPLERLLFIGLWNFCDDQGYLDYRPKKIKMQVLPADDIDIPRALASLARASLVVPYQGPEGVVLHIRNWKKHQRVSNAARERYAPSDLHELSEWDPTLASPRDSYPAEGKGREGKGKDGRASRALTEHSPEPFDEPHAELETVSPETVFPKGWGPGARHIAFAAESALDIRGEFSRFADHARDKGRTSRDWDAALMGWLRDSATRSKRPAGNRRVTPDDRINDHVQLVARLSADDHPKGITA